MTSPRTLCGEEGIRRLVSEAFGTETLISDPTEIGGGRGTFSDVYHLRLVPAGRRSHRPSTAAGGTASPQQTPATVVAKLPADSANRDAAATIGAYDREDIAYRYLVPHSPIAAPVCFARIADGSTAAFLLEDLTGHRFVDQIQGLQAHDAAAVAEQLARLHRFWTSELTAPGNPVGRHNVRRATVSALSTERLEAGLGALRRQWAEIGDETVAAFAAVVNERERLVERFAAGMAGSAAPGQLTLCHGDPRADNLCFGADGTPVLFDWQQIAVQFGEADLAWLAATSLEPDVRRRCEADLLDVYGGDADRYRLGFVLPGMAALMLAQRVADRPRTRRFIATSLRRIGTALDDHQVAKI
jgi:aminoglycoside phosphotransferase (APT) family kinase protein